jgi:type IX secretion system PorP/SprF family membrane protein
MLKLWLSIVLYFACASLVAQQLPQYNQYIQNNFLLNPALAGIENYADAKMGYRKQWVGLTSSPTTFYATGHLPIGNSDFDTQPATPRFAHTHSQTFDLPEPHFGAGFVVVKDQVGPLSNFLVNLSGSFHYPISDYWQLSAGLSAGFSQFSINFDQIQLSNSSDPLVAEGKVNVFKPNLNAGLWAYSSEWFAGFSVQQLAAGKLKFQGTSQMWEGALIPHYFLTIGRRLELNDDWAFVPSVLFKATTSTPPSFDLNLKIDYQNVFWGGVSYRQKSSFNFFTGIRLKDSFTVGYGYEYPLLILTTTGSHEVTIGYTIGGHNHYASPRSFW